MGKNTTAENYRQFINSPAIQTAKYFFNVLLKEEYTCLNKYIIEIKTGKTPPKSNSIYFSSDDINWFKPSDIGNDIYLSEATSKLSNIAKIEKKITNFKKNTLLITCIGDIGRIGILKKEATANQQITGVLFNNKLIPEYAYLYFVSNRELFIKNGVLKTTLPIINQKIIKNLYIKVPTIKIQKQVVEFFFYFLKNNKPSNELFIESYTKKILNFSQKVNSSKIIGSKLYNEIQTQQTLLKQLRQSILQEAIEGKLTISWREKNPNIESATILLEKIKAEKERLIKEKKIKKQKALVPIDKSEVPFDIPNGWVWCRLGEVIKSYQNGISKRNGNGTPTIVLRLADIKEYKIDLTDYRKIQLSDKEQNKYLLNENDILVTRVNGSVDIVGNFNLVRKQKLDLSYCDHFIRIRFLNKFILSEYIEKVEKTTLVRNIIKKEFKTTSGQKTINQGHISHLLIPFPPLEEQKQIVQKIETLFNLCDKLEEQINTSKKSAEMLMQSVLKEAFGE